MNKQIRTGKTAKDRENGASERRLANRASRVAWQHVAGTPFPTHACGGKKNTKKKHNSKMGK